MNHSVLINKTNSLLTSFNGSAIGTFLPFGQLLTSCTADEARRSLILTRMTKKWYVPDNSVSQERRSRSIDNWINLERKIENFTYSPSQDERWHCYRASMLIYQWLSPLKKTLAPSGDVEFTKGESYNSMRGLTSVRQKLRNLKHWTVTYEAADEAAVMIWCNRALRTSAWTHLGSLFYDDCAKYLWVSNTSEMDAFVHLVKTYLFRYVTGARMALVPKNNEVDRVINVEPTFNMLLQRQVGLSIRRILNNVGNDLLEGQSRHRD